MVSLRTGFDFHIEHRGIVNQQSSSESQVIAVGIELAAVKRFYDDLFPRWRKISSPDSIIASSPIVPTVPSERGP